MFTQLSLIHCILHGHIIYKELEIVHVYLIQWYVVLLVHVATYDYDINYVNNIC